MTTPRPDNTAPLDVTARVKGAAELGLTITRKFAKFAYPKNGNCHNPTPKYFWTVSHGGRLVGTLDGFASVRRFVAEDVAPVLAAGGAL